MNEKIFINYRQDDSPWNSLALYRELIKYFPKENIFKDFNTIAPGTDFVESIEKALEECDVLLVLISENWLTLTDRKGNKRINNPDDFVRLEIATALKRNICVIPVLFDNATLPQADELPDDLKKLSRRQFIEIDKIRFDADTTRLVEAIKKALPHRVPNPQPTPPAGDDPIIDKKKKTSALKFIVIGIAIIVVILIIVTKLFSGAGSHIASKGDLQKGVDTNLTSQTQGDKTREDDSKKSNVSPNQRETSVSPPRDADGNVYETIAIGKQTWFKENLRTTHYRNGTAMPNVIDNAQWANASTGAYCNLNNDASNSSTYGLLYNWYAVNNPSGLCPAGWHVPSSEEWRTLIDFLGGDNTAGTAMKATILWDKQGEVANNLTNSSGFSAVPAGERWAKGDFANGNWAYIWSSSYNIVGLNYNNPRAYLMTGSNQTEKSGYSCRCIKD